MSDSIVTAAGGVAPGQITFYESCRPPLTAGPYDFIVSQEVQKLKDGKPAPEFKKTQPFVVAAPRFSLLPTDVHMVFPPANQEGVYTDVLPHIVLTKRALPWMRSISDASPTAGGGSDDDGPPWMGVLTFYPEDASAARAIQVIDTAAQTNGGPAQYKSVQMGGKPIQMTVADVVNPKDPDVLAPVLKDVTANDLKQSCLAFDVDVQLFQGIAPRLNELPYLAHAREVNTDGKVILGLDEDGMFSVVVGNRVAKSSADAAVVNTCYLVSLEGHQDHLPGGASIDPKYKWVRLVSLASWSFTAAASPGDFIGLMQALILKGRGGVELLRLPYAETATTDQEKLAKEAIDIGFVPLENDMRVGEQTTSWYRGPFVPVTTRRDNTYGPYLFSDHAMHYDPACGIFNLAYAVAWQIGRLLALSDATFAKDVFLWRVAHSQQNAKMVDGAMYREHLGRTLAFPEDTAEPLGRTHFHGMLFNFWHRNVGGALQSAEADVPLVQARQLRARPLSVPGLLQPEEVDEILNSDEEPVQALLRRILRQ